MSVRKRRREIRVRIWLTRLGASFDHGRELIPVTDGCALVHEAKQTNRSSGGCGCLDYVVTIGQEWLSTTEGVQSRGVGMTGGVERRPGAGCPSDRRPKTRRRSSTRAWVAP